MLNLKDGFYSWIPDKKLFAEFWGIARKIAAICEPYHIRNNEQETKLEMLKKKFNAQTLKSGGLGGSISERTYNELVHNCPENVSVELVKKWLDRVKVHPGSTPIPPSTPILPRGDEAIGTSVQF